MKSKTFYIKTFDYERQCWKCHKDIPKKCPSITYKYHTCGSIFEMSCCTDCTGKVFLEEREAVGDLWIKLAEELAEYKGLVPAEPSDISGVKKL